MFEGGLPGYSLFDRPNDVTVYIKSTLCLESWNETYQYEEPYGK